MSIVFDITPEVVKAFAPELSSLTDEFWADCLEFVAEYDLVGIGESIATDRFFKINLAAHFGTMEFRGQDGGAVGPVTSEAAGGLRRSYGFQSFAESSGLGLTPYGMQCIFILRGTFAILPIVG